MSEKEIYIGERSGKTYNKIQEMAKEIVELEKENEELKEKIAELQADKNKLINYIAIRENKTHEDICKEFEV